MYIISSWRNASNRGADGKGRIANDSLLMMSSHDSSAASMVTGLPTDATVSSCTCRPSANVDGALPPLRDELASSDTDGPREISSAKHDTPTTHSLDWSSSDADVSGQSKWNFDPATDRFNHSLSDSQCEEAFPDYYKEIDRAAMFWKEDKITQEDMNITDRTSVVRAMIYDRQLYVIASHINNQPGVYDLYRAMAILGSLHRVIIAHQGPIPDVEFVFSVSDVERNPAPAWTLCRAPEDEAHWVMPDFGYWAWDNDIVGSYQQLLKEVAEKPSEFSEKKKLAFWRGTDSNEERHDLLRNTEGKEWADIEGVVWGAPGQLVKMADHCDYQYLIQTEGTYRRYSFPLCFSPFPSILYHRH